MQGRNPARPAAGGAGCGMKIAVRVKPNSKQNLVEPTGKNQYTVRVKEKAIEGRANDAVIALLAKHFGVPKSNITVIIGAKSRNKLITVR